jgi:hypothetical protein
VILGREALGYAHPGVLAISRSGGEESLLFHCRHKVTIIQGIVLAGFPPGGELRERRASFFRFISAIRGKKTGEMAGRGPVGPEKRGTRAGPGRGRPALYPASTRVDACPTRPRAEVVPWSCRPSPGINIRLPQKLVININRLMMGRQPRAGTRYRWDGFNLPISLRLIAGVSFLSRPGMGTA